MQRRQFLGALASAGLASADLNGASFREPAGSDRSAESVSALASMQERRAPTQFQLACMTLPYAAFPLERALVGIQGAGYSHVAWGVTHREADGQARPTMDLEAPPRAAADLSRRCRDHGLQPVMMFSTVFLEEPDAAAAHTKRIAQAAAAGIPFLLTFGRTSPGQYERVIDCLKTIGPIARKEGVMVVIKQHGGNTATGAQCAKIIGEVGDEGVRMCYDAGNVLDYESHDPIADIATCVGDIRAFAIKDHRDWPKDEDCGPGFGEIDHYRLLQHVLHTGLTMPLACENIFEPLVRRPTAPEGVDALARRAREYVDSVIRGLQAQA